VDAQLLAVAYSVAAGVATIAFFVGRLSAIVTALSSKLTHTDLTLDKIWARVDVLAAEIRRK
jgi:hypothetical protein